MKHIFTLALSAFITVTAVAQQKSTFIDASKVMKQPETGKLKMGNPGPKGKEIEVNSLYMTLDKKPILPVMGEMHFSRIKPDQWEDCILKMKACGVNVISTYLFWNQHEEIEGQFTWENEKDIRAFIELCQKHGVYSYPRIGPWSHGEMRNGGTPDWLLRKKYMTDRSNDAVYQTYVQRYFKQIAEQFDGLYYKDGGNIIGIQLENEYWYAKAGEPHMTWLKETAQKMGMDVPMYTVTGWGGGSVPPFEVIPLWGGYADEPWVEKVTKNVLAFNFQFDSFRDNKHIGNDQIDHKSEYMKYDSYPYFTCEMGVGVPQMYHRRTIVSPIDGLGMMIAKLGSGSNLLGYYVFAGGTNPRGELYGTEEEQEQTGYWCRTVPKSYDFQAAIKESGELADSYKQVKKLHYFVDDFGSELAPTMPVTTKAPDEELQLAVRSNNNAGYLFGINYCRYIPKKAVANKQFSVKFANETLTFPQQPIAIADSTVFIWPMNLNIGTALLKYATAQLLCKTNDTYIFFQNKNIPPEFAFDKATVDNVSVTRGKTEQSGNRIIVTDLRPGQDCVINLNLKDGSQQKILVLTELEADNAWLFTRNGKKEFYISDANLYMKDNSLYGFTAGNDITLNTYADGRFTKSIIPVQHKANETSKIALTPRPFFAEAKWLESENFSNIEDYKARYHRFFFKEFSLDNPSGFRKATLYIYPETVSCLMNINEKWVRQEVKPNQLNAIDITGYVQKGHNMLFLDFPYTEGKAGFAARVVVSYVNYDRVEFSSDESWLTTDMYTHPSATRPYNKPEKPVVLETPEFIKTLKYDGFSEWDLKVPHQALDQLSGLYGHLSYIGDRAELYNGYRLCFDDFNFNIPWQFGLQRMKEANPEGRDLRLVIYPLSKETKIFFDNLPATDEYDKAAVKKFEVIQEYPVKIN